MQVKTEVIIEDKKISYFDIDAFSSITEEPDYDIIEKHDTQTDSDLIMEI